MKGNVVAVPVPDADDEVVLGRGTKDSVWVACAVPFVTVSAWTFIDPVAVSQLLIVRLKSWRAAIGW